MRAHETASALAAFESRGAGTDAERRAARWLADELAATGREARIETFWCRPNWALAHSAHVALAVAGSLLSVRVPAVGGALLLAALLSMIADEQFGLSPGRLLSHERASQNVVAAAPGRRDRAARQIRLIVFANYDAGRLGLVYRQPVRAASALMRRATRGFTLGWLGWVGIAIAALIAVAVLRATGHHTKTIAIVQLGPTIALVLVLALLLDIAVSDFSPAAASAASGVAVALGVVRALDAAPPREMTVEVVIQGAGEGGGIGLRRYLRGRRHDLRRADTILVGIGPSGIGELQWWRSDGALIPRRYSPRLSELCAAIAAGEPWLGMRAHRGRGNSPAEAALISRLPAIAIGCLDRRGLVPHANQPDDLASTIDPGAIDRAVELGLMLVDEIDATLADSTARSEPTRA